MSDSICPDLTRYAKALENFTERQEQSIVEIGMRWRPRLAEVTESFYEKLLAIPETAKFLQGRVDRLKKSPSVMAGADFLWPLRRELYGLSV